MARQDFLDAQSLVDKLNKEFDKHRGIIEATAESVQKLQAEYKKLPSDYLKIQREIQNTLKAQANAEKALTQAKQQTEKLTQDQIRTAKARLALTQAETKAADQKAKAEAKATAELAKAENFYNRVNVRVRALTATYNDLAMRKELGMKLNTKEEAQLASMEKRLIKYQGAIAKVNERIGKYGHNVGNYASGTNQLNLAVGQFARELPNAGISLNTFIISLSNQFGQLIDGINATVAANKELIKQGQPVKSVLAQIMSSVFSLQTALFLGIAVFTAYNDEITTWIGGLFGANEQLEKLRENQEKLNTSQRTGLKSTVEARTALKENLAIARDTALSDTERQIALKKLRAEYPLYFKNLTDQQILAGQTAEAEEKIIEALNKRGQANEAANVIAENDKRLIDLEAELKKEQDLLVANRKRVELRRQQAQGDAQFSGALANAETAYANSQEKVNKLLEERTEINKQNVSQQDLILKLRKESIGLDYQEEEGQNKQLQREALVDFEASEYEARRRRLELEGEAQRKMTEDTTNGFADREAAAKRYNEILLELAEMRRVESVRVLHKETDDTISELKRRAAEGEITQRNANAVISSIEKDERAKLKLIHEEYSADVISANETVEESFKNVWGNISEQERSNKVAEAQIANLRQMALLYDNIGGETTNAQYAKLENNIRKIGQLQEDNAVNELRAKRDSIQAEIDKIKQQEKSEINNEAINKLLGEQLALDTQILNVENKRAEEIANLHRQMKEATRDYLDSYSQGFLEESGLGSLGKIFDQVTYQVVNDLGEIETRTGSTFDKLYDQAQTTGEKIAVVFTTMTDVMTQAFEFARQNQEARFDAEYAGLERQRDIQLQFAGESEAGRAEIERQYEEKRREIRIREAKAQKEQALFNAIVNTAQAVVAALPNIPLSVIVGALGAAQIAMIASRPIPAYAEGTDNHEGGLMLVNDAKGGNYQELIKTPDGKAYLPKGRNVLMDAPKGTQVLKAGTFDKELNALLEQNSIAPFAATLLRDTYGEININSGGGLTRDDLDSVMAKYTSKSSFVLNVDENGFNAYKQQRNTRTQIIGGRITGKGTGI